MIASLEWSQFEDKLLNLVRFVITGIKLTMIIIIGFTCFGNKYPISEAKSLALWLGNDIVCTYVMACTHSLHDCGKPNLFGYLLPLAH